MRRRHSGAAALGHAVLIALACDDANDDVRSPSVVLLTGGTGAASGSGGTAGTATGGLGSEAGQGEFPEPPGPPCNAWSELCERPYDEVSFPVAHAAMANTESFWDYPAQRRPLRTQLDDSIRGLMLEVFEDDGEPALCFHDCAEGRSELLPELRHVQEFFADNPREIVTLLIDNHVPAPDIAAAVVAAGLDQYLFIGEVDGGWPTLGELVDGGTRLVVFVRDAASAPPGYRDFDASIASTGDAFRRARDLDCELAAGDDTAPMLLVHQTLVTGSATPGSGGEAGAPAASGRPSEELAETVNREPFLGERLSLCAQSFGKNPTFVAVDFYDTSDLIGATQRLGGLID
jgi:hypothetical protein